MKNLIVAIGGTGGSTIRSLKYRLGLFNSGEQVKEVYIDALSKDLVESGKTSEFDPQKDKFRTMDTCDISSYAEYKGGDLVKLGQLLETEASSRQFNSDEAYRRHIYRWFQSHYYTQIGSKAILESVAEGAGRFRQFGRMLVDRNYDAVTVLLRNRIQTMDDTFKVYMVFSLAGGTGAGAAFPTAVLIRSIANKLNKQPIIYAFIVMARAFQREEAGTPYAALRELSRLNNVDENYKPKIVFNGTLQNTEMLDRRLFDAKFVLDMSPAIAGLGDDSLRHLGLYPSLADMMELLIQERQSQHFFEAAANWPQMVSEARQQVDPDVEIKATAESGEQYQALSKGLSVADDWFSTYKIIRVYFPKDLYVEIACNRLVIKLIDDLFPRKSGNVLRDAISESGEEITESEPIKKKLNEHCYNMLSEWNLNFLDSVAGEEFKASAPFYERRISAHFDTYQADVLIRSLFTSQSSAAEQTISDLQSIDIRKACAGAIVSKQDDLNTFKTSLELERDRIRQQVAQYLTMPDNYNQNRIRKGFAEYGLRLLNRPHKEGALGFTAELFRYLSEYYLPEILNRLEKRQNSFKERETRMRADASDLSTSMHTKFKKSQQKQLLSLEQDLVEVYLQHCANGKLIDYTKFAIAEAGYWRDLLGRWAADLAVRGEGSLRAAANDAIERSTGILKELALSTGILVGLEGMEPSSSGRGAEAIWTPETIPTDMGGFQQYVEELLLPDRILDGWKRNFLWHASIPEQLPTESVMERISPKLSVADEEQGRDEIKDPVALGERLLDTVRDTAKERLEGVDVFKYLLDFAPQQREKSVSDIATLLGRYLRDRKHFLDFNAAKGIWHSFLAYNPGDRDVSNFIHVLETEVLKANEFAPKSIPNYGDGNSLVFIHFVVGLSAGDAPSITVPRDAYIESMNKAIRDSGNRAHRLSGVLSQHIFPEEQEMLRFEIEEVSKRVLKGAFTDRDFIPLELAPLFVDTERTKLFARLYAAGMIEKGEVEGRTAHCYSSTLRSKAEGTPYEFVLAQSGSVLDAAKAFVMNEENWQQNAVNRVLPPHFEMRNSLNTVIKEYYLRDESLREQLTEKGYTEAALSDAALVNLLKKAVKELEALGAQDLQERFKVGYGASRDTDPETLRRIFLLFFYSVIDETRQKRDEIVRDSKRTDLSDFELE